MAHERMVCVPWLKVSLGDVALLGLLVKGGRFCDLVDSVSRVMRTGRSSLLCEEDLDLMLSIWHSVSPWTVLCCRLSNPGTIQRWAILHMQEGHVQSTIDRPCILAC